MKVFKAPERAKYEGPTVFFAGSIDMGKAEDWQTKLTKALADVKGTIFNPRRDDWDSSWEQDISNPKFNEQVKWELDHMDKADVIAMYFDPKGQAPITLEELGLHAKENKVIVLCPKGYWKRGNVEITCKRYNVPFMKDWDSFVTAIKAALKSKGSKVVMAKKNKEETELRNDNTSGPYPGQANQYKMVKMANSKNKSKRRTISTHAKFLTKEECAEYNELDSILRKGPGARAPYIDMASAKLRFADLTTKLNKAQAAEDDVHSQVRKALQHRDEGDQLMKLASDHNTYQAGGNTPGERIKKSQELHGKGLVHHHKAQEFHNKHYGLPDIPQMESAPKKDGPETRKDKKEAKERSTRNSEKMRKHLNHIENFHHGLTPKQQELRKRLHVRQDLEPGANVKWWDSMSREAQKEYLYNHPDSKKKVGASVDAGQKCAHEKK